MRRYYIEYESWLKLQSKESLENLRDELQYEMTIYFYCNMCEDDECVESVLDYCFVLSELESRFRETA